MGVYSVKPAYRQATAIPRARSWLVAFSYLLLGVVALVPRVLSLGEFVTVDEISFWIQRSDTFLRAMASGNYAATAISTHPGVTTMWLGSAGILLRRALLAWGMIHDDAFPTTLALFRLPVVLAHTAGLLVGYGLLRRVLPAAMAATAAFLWATDPFVIAYSRVLHVDGLAGTFLTVSLLAACVYWFHQPRARFLLLSGVSAGLAILSKSPALALLPAVGMIALLQGSGARGQGSAERATARFWHFAWPLIGWGVVVLVTVVAVWPALWASPLQAIEQIRVGVVGEGAEPHMQGNFFMGQPDDAPGLLFYPVALALRLTPWTLLGLLLLPLVWRRAGAWAGSRRDLAALAGFAILFILAMSVFPKKFNRYIEPTFPAIDILAAVGLIGLGDWWARFERFARLRARLNTALASVLVLAALVNVAFWHPYEIAAYNQALGGAPAGAYAFLTGWGEGLEQVADWLNAQPDITGVRVASTQPWALQPYLRAGAQTLAPGNDMPDHTGYMVVYVRSVQGGIWPPFDQFYGRTTPAHVVRIHGVDYVWIYRVPPQPSQPVAADFGPAIQLRGLTLERPAKAGEPLALKLFWSARDQPASNVMLFAHLIGSDGQRAAQIDLPFPTDDMHAGQYITSELPLPVPAATPAGSYQLVIGLYDLASGQRLALSAAAPIDPALDGPDALPLTKIQLP